MQIRDWSSDVCSSDLAARRRGVRLIKADEIELVEDAARGRKLLGNLVLHRFPPGVESALATREQVVERREGNRHLFAERLERAIRHRLQPRIGQDIEGETGEAIRRMVIKEAGGDQLAIGVDRKSTRLNSSH